MPALDLAANAHASSRTTAHSGPAHGRNPRVRAAFAYAIPVLPALWLLLRERRNRFVRLHAARSLAFFAALALAQIILFVALVLTGGTVDNLTTAALLGILFYALYLVVAALAFVFWLLLMRDALAGRATAYPLLGGSAGWLERRITRLQNRLFPPRAV